MHYTLGVQSPAACPPCSLVFFTVNLFPKVHFPEVLNAHPCLMSALTLLSCVLVSTVHPRKRSDKQEDRSFVNEGRASLNIGEEARTQDRSNWFLLHIGIWERTKVELRLGLEAVGRDLRGMGIGNPGKKAWAHRTGSGTHA